MRKVLVILFLVISSVVSATNYYVKNGGSDAASGTSDATAWAHHPWMSTWTGHITLVAGDNVFMKRGDTWIIANPTAAFIFTAQSGTAGRSITTTAYGTGNDPVIKISTNSNYPVIRVYGDSYLTFDHLHIQHYSSSYSGSDMYGILITKKGIITPHHITITDCEIDNIPKTCVEAGDDSYYIVIGDTTATQTASATNYSNHFHNFGYAGVILLGCDPSSNESHFNVYYNYIHDATNKVVSSVEYGISFTANSASTSWPKYAIAKYNRVENINTWSAVSSHGGSYEYFQNNYVKNFGRSGIAVSAGTEGSLGPIFNNIYIEENIIELPSSGWILGSQNGFISVDDETMGTNLFVDNNTIFYTSQPSSDNWYGIQIANINGGTINGNLAYNGPTTSEGWGVIHLSKDGEKGLTISKNYFYDWPMGINMEGAGIVGSIAINNNVIRGGHGDCPLSVTDADLSATAKVTVYNNDLLVDTYPYNFYTAYGIISGGSMIFKNNIFTRAVSHSDATYIYWGGTIAGTFTCDYNMYWNSTNSKPFNLKGTNQNWAGWNAYGYDTHSLNNSDPLFMNKSGSYSESLDFVLQSTSPAINKGTAVTEVIDDFFGNPRDTTPDIGAYEYVIPVASITVTGAAGSNTITSSKGTLQLISSISPSDAVNKTVTWLIANGTGQASISSTGLVTAVADGTVTARASATDGSGAYGTLFITISNQGNADSTNFKGQPVTIYPNPAHEYINIRIVEQKLVPDFIRIFNLSGKVFLQYKVNPDVTDLHIPLNLIEGIYILQLGSGNTTMFTQKLIVD